VCVGQDKNDGRNDGDDTSQRQPVEKRGQLHNENFPQKITKSRRLIDGPLLPKRFPNAFLIAE
jgi:hypothetical protein